MKKSTMPSIPIHPPALPGTAAASVSGFPQILATPSGLAILEIQGTINASGAPEDSSRTVGKLSFPGYDASKGADDTSWHKRVYLYVGKHQRLTGEVKKLAKPVAVLRRRTQDGGEGGTGPGVDGDALEIADIVRWKLLFAHRPEPVGGEASADA